MVSFIDESSDPITRTPTGVDQMTEIQPLPDDLMPGDSSNPPITAAITSGGFLVANWLVGLGEG